jgi:hypothetical protein
MGLACVIRTCEHRHKLETVQLARRKYLRRKGNQRRAGEGRLYTGVWGLAALRNGAKNAKNAREQGEGGWVAGRTGEVG